MCVGFHDLRLDKGKSKRCGFRWNRLLFELMDLRRMIETDHDIVAVLKYYFF